jgi:hypothetical protein
MGKPRGRNEREHMSQLGSKPGRGSGGSPNRPRRLRSIAPTLACPSVLCLSPEPPEAIGSLP